MDAEIIIIGAGLAGLAAARILEKSKKVILLEARDRLGGRLFTNYGSGQAVELGAEFVHGEPGELLELIELGAQGEPGEGGETGEPSQIVNEAELQSFPDKHYFFEEGKFHLEHEFWQNIESFLKQVPKDESTTATVDKIFSKDQTRNEKLAQNFIENFHAADLTKMGLKEFFQDEGGSSEQTSEMHVLKSGYTKWLNRFVESLQSPIFFNREVYEVEWQADSCVVKVKHKNDEEIFTAKKVILSLPLGVLKAGKVRFLPSLPIHLDHVHMGAVLRFSLLFHESPWFDDFNEGGFIHSDVTHVSVYWVSPTKKLITAWVGGPRAARLSEKSDNEIFEIVLSDLSFLFQKDVAALRKQVSGRYFHNWKKDPYSLGAYSYLGPNGKNEIEALMNAGKDTIYFAGEAMVLDASRGTVQGAIRSGQEVAKRILQLLGNSADVLFFSEQD